MNYECEVRSAKTHTLTSTLKIPDRLFNSQRHVKLVCRAGVSEFNFRLLNLNVVKIIENKPLYLACSVVKLMKLLHILKIKEREKNK